MREALANVRGRESRELRRRIVGLYAVLISFNAVAWGWAFAAFHQQPLLLGAALLAYSFGIRHAVDADHIAAIDNVTRKLMQDGQRPVGVGLFFSLGHSTVVILLSLAIAFTAARLQFTSFKAIGGMIGAGVSAAFLFAISIANLSILVALRRKLQAAVKGERLAEEDLDLLFGDRGLLARWARPLFRLITKSWQLYPIGFLFGLGFDTATEIGLLGISATQSAQGLCIWSIMLFPALFAAGMTLIDSTDGILMLGAYGWAFARPFRKLYYNMTITFISAAVAVLVGAVEAFGLIADKIGLRGDLRDALDSMNDNFGLIGLSIIALLMVSWIISALIYKVKRYDEIDAEPVQPIQPV